MPGKKSTQIDIERRLVQVQKWIVECKSTDWIRQQCVNKKWCESSRTADRLIKKSKERWVKDQEANILQERILKEQELIELKRSLKSKYKGTPAGIMALARVDAQIIKLKGLASPQKVQLTGKDGGPIEMDVKVDRTIDYTKLSTKALEEILSARVKKAN